MREGAAGQTCAPASRTGPCGWERVDMEIIRPMAFNDTYDYVRAKLPTHNCDLFDARRSGVLMADPYDLAH